MTVGWYKGHRDTGQWLIRLREWHYPKLESKGNSSGVGVDLYYSGWSSWRYAHNIQSLPSPKKDLLQPYLQFGHLRCVPSSQKPGSTTVAQGKFTVVHAFHAEHHGTKYSFIHCKYYACQSSFSVMTQSWQCCQCWQIWHFCVSVYFLVLTLTYQFF